MMDLPTIRRALPVLEQPVTVCCVPSVFCAVQPVSVAPSAATPQSTVGDMLLARRYMVLFWPVGDISAIIALYAQAFDRFCPDGRPAGGVHGTDYFQSTFAHSCDQLLCDYGQDCVQINPFFVKCCGRRNCAKSIQCR